jgi:hypothetical protein
MCLYVYAYVFVCLNVRVCLSLPLSLSLRLRLYPPGPVGALGGHQEMGRSYQEAGNQQVMSHATCHMPHATPLARARALALSLSRSLAVCTPEVRHMYISDVIF